MTSLRLLLRNTLLFIPVCILPTYVNAQIPENNDPCPTDANPPIDLTSIGTHLGTTCEATFDYANIDCGSNTQDGSVWYTYTPNMVSDGYDVILSMVGGADDAEGPITIEVYKGSTNQGCTGFTETIASSCSAIEKIIKIPNNFSTGEIIYVKITSDPGASNCGEFNLSITPGSCGTFADNCSDITAFQSLTPTTLNGFEINYECLSGCLTYANPDLSATAGCDEFTDNPTVWYKIEEDGMGAQLYTTVVTNGNWQPVWSIWGGDDCGNLTLMESEGNTCSNEDLTPDLYQIAINPMYDIYWVAVSLDPNSLPVDGIDDGTFEICASTTVNGIVCLGSLEGDCAEPGLVFEVIEREVEGASLSGPFCPGEEVTINVSFFYDASETSSDWFSGFVPKFGPGWDVTNWNPENNKPFANGMQGDWYMEDYDCAPLIQEDVPHLCTYINEYGKLELCNNLCESCADCPIQGMQALDPLPSGYFWVTNGANAECQNDCSPGEGWGVGSTLASVEWEFTISVKEFDNYNDCFSNNDLQISIQTFSQGVAGCWEDPVGECLIDKSQFSPLWKADCNFPSNIVAEDQEICYNGTTSVSVETADGTPFTIIVEAEDNPHISGESNHEFPGGSGTIIDNLLNETDDEQTVVYHIYAEDVALTCQGNINTIEVIVYPKININLPPNHIVCEGECIIIYPEVWGGYPGTYSYEWGNGETTSALEVCPDVSETYFLTITDGLGCEESVDILVEVKSAVQIIVAENITVCKDGDFDPFNPEYIVCVEIIGGTTPYNITWDEAPGLIGSATGNMNECFTIDEESSSEFAGTLALGVSVLDQFLCGDEVEIEVEVVGSITLDLSVPEFDCGDTVATIDVDGFVSTGDPVTQFLLYGGCPEDENGDFLEEVIAGSGSATFPSQDLNSYTCYQVVGVAENGCTETAEIEIPLDEGISISIIGSPLEVCEGDEVTLTITNSEAFVDLNWLTLPWANGSYSIAFSVDSTTSYIVEAIDTFGCLSQGEITIVVHPTESEFCEDPCENQMYDFQISGLAFSDDNGNGVMDQGELPLANVIITDVFNNFSVFTNALGMYTMPVDSGYLMIQASISQGIWVNSEIVKNIFLDIPCFDNFNFGFIPDTYVPMGSISVNNTITRCDWETRFYITVENLNHEPIDGRIEFSFDEDVSFFSSEIPGIQVANNIAIFDTGLLLGFTPKVFEITLKMPSGSTSLPELTFKAELFDGDILVDTYNYTQQLRCSYDPNDKRTYPDRVGDENITLKEEQLEYTIRFQNNGNDTAFHVRLLDIIDSNIITSSIRFINASHPYEACLSGDTLIIDFPDIMLVDSMTNYDASQGFVVFSCDIDPNVVIGTEIHNTVDIIFDTNIPIVTNITLNTIVDVLCTDVSTDLSESICEGESFLGFTEAGNYQIDLTTTLGCDSIISLDLGVIIPDQTFFGPISVCEGDVIEVGGTVYEFDSSGIYTNEIPGPSGCIEEVLTLTIEIVEAVEKFETFVICDGDSLFYEAEMYAFDSSGIYVFEIPGPSGCIEEIVTMDIEIVEGVEKFEQFVICQGDLLSYEGDVYEFESSGIYDFEILNENGCVIEYLKFDITLIIPIEIIIIDDICEGEIITIGELTFEFDSSGTYTHFEDGPSGCDEIILEFQITLYETTYTEIDTTICEGQSYEGYEETGQYAVESTDPSTGCPIIHTINLNVLPISDPNCITAIEDIETEVINLYPVPTSDLIFVEATSKVKNASLLSSGGQIIKKWSQLDSKNLKLNFSDVNAGFHLIMIETELGRVIKKVIISN